jgi:transposase
VNRVKANLARLGIRGFRPSLAQASRQLETSRTPEGAAVPANTLAELRRDMTRLCFVKQQIKEIETTRTKRLERAAREGRNAMVHLLARVVGVGVETADMLVQEVFSRNLRDRKAVARYAGLTGAPDESGQKRLERGTCQGRQCARAPGDDPARLGSSVASEGQRAGRWYRKRTADARGGTRKTMIVALASSSLRFGGW